MARDAQLSGPAPDARPAGETEKRRRGPFGFIGESWAELQKVEWPNQNQIVQGTAVVLIACIIVGVYLYANDQLWSHLVNRLLLK